MDFKNLLEIADIKQKKTEKRKNPAKEAREKKVSSENVKNFLQRQKEEEKRKAEEEKRKKLELLKKRVEANTKKKPVDVKPKVDKEKEIFDMNDEEAEKAKQVELKKQSSDEFKGLKISDFDFETKKDRKARAPTDAAMAAKQKLERIKAKMKGCSDVDRMAEIDRELSDDEKKPKIKSSDKEWHSSSKDKHRDRDKRKHRDGKHQSKHSSSSSHKSKHEHSSSSHSKSSSKPYSSTKHNVSDSDSDISDISLEEVKPTPKTQSWVSVKKTTATAPVVEKPKPKINKPKSLAPPPPSFRELMELAEKKNTEPVTLKPSVAEIPKKKKYDRPMTQEEKDRIARTSTKEYKDWIKYGKRPPKVTPKPIDRSSLAPHPTRPGASANEAKPKAVVPHPTRPAGKVLSNGMDKGSRNGVTSSNKYSERSSLSSKNGQNRDSSRNGRESSKNSQSSKSNTSRNDADSEILRKMKESEDQFKMAQANIEKLKKQLAEMQKQKTSAAAASKPSGVSSSKSSSSSSRPESSSKSRPPQPSSRNGVAKGSKRPKHDMSDEEDAPPAKKPAPPQPYTNPFDRIMGKYQERNPKPKKKPQPVEDDFIDDDYDDEYDSEMDDFIDDGEDETPNYSKHIRGIFGYDRRKYRNERDDDLRGMETNFAEISKEEARSARLGMLEDLEDIKREEEELKRKKKKR